MIRGHIDIPYFLAHGSKDEYMPLSGPSLFGCFRNKEPSNVTTYLCEGLMHSFPWKTEAASNYYKQTVTVRVQEINAAYSDPVEHEEHFQELVRQTDRELLSQLNEELLESVNEMFLSAIA